MSVARVVGPLFSLLPLASPTLAADAPWPAPTVHVIVAQAVGGPPDLIARFIAEPLGRALAVPVVVDNRPGASGAIGVSAAAQAAPDGYGTLSTHALDAPWQDPHLLAAMLELSFEPAGDGGRDGPRL